MILSNRQIWNIFYFRTLHIVEDTSLNCISVGGEYLEGKKLEFQVVKVTSGCPSPPCIRSRRESGMGEPGEAATTRGVHSWLTVTRPYIALFIKGLCLLIIKKVTDILQFSIQLTQCLVCVRHCVRSEDIAANKKQQISPTNCYPRPLHGCHRT